MENNPTANFLIFVIGRNRSGTKWLSNILSESTDVSSIQREGAGGILECNLLSTYPKNFNLKDIEEKTAFEILFQHDNYHLCSDLNDSILSQIDYKDCYEFFEKYTKQISSVKQTSFFLQKASSNLLPLLLKKYPNAKYVVIQRKNVVDNVISNLLLHSNKVKNTKLFFLLLGYWRYRKLENKYDERCPNLMKISYEELKINTEETAMKICGFLNINFTKEMLIPKYKPNTSFKSGTDRSSYLSKSNKAFIKIFSFILKLTPPIIFKLLFKIRILSNDSPNLFITKTFELHRKAKNRHI